uniref:Secreted protein n=1 Tax=Globodera pallida TaxID=36090 RepID=A0A183CCH9_GLOPA
MEYPLTSTTGTSVTAKMMAEKCDTKGKCRQCRNPLRLWFTEFKPPMKRSKLLANVTGYAAAPLVAIIAAVATVALEAVPAPTASQYSVLELEEKQIVVQLVQKFRPNLRNESHFPVIAPQAVRDPNNCSIFRAKVKNWPEKLFAAYLIGPGAEQFTLIMPSGANASETTKKRIASLEREVQTSTSSRGLPFLNLYDGSDEFPKAPKTLEEALMQARRVEQVQGSFIENNWKQTQGTKAEIALSEVNAIRTEWNELRERLRAKDQQMHLNSECHQDWDENCYENWDENYHQNWDENCHQNWDENCHQDWDENCHQNWNENCYQYWDEDCHQDWDENCHQDWEDDCQHDWNEDCRHDWDSGLHCEEIG